MTPRQDTNGKGNAGHELVSGAGGNLQSIGGAPARVHRTQARGSSRDPARGDRPRPAGGPTPPGGARSVGHAARALRHQSFAAGAA